MLHRVLTQRLGVTLSFILTAGLITETSSPAVAATENGTFAARGPGAANCATIVEQLEGPNSDMTAVELSSWVSGYLSHANRATPGVYDVMPIQDIFGVSTIVARLCENNPDSLLEPVMARLLEMMESGRQTEETELITVSADGTEINLRQAVMISAQRELIERDYLTDGGDDGDFGPRTRNAFSDFQAEAGIPETGLPDAITLFLLFNSN